MEDNASKSSLKLKKICPLADLLKCMKVKNYAYYAKVLLVT
jgi:hypothetical protein